MKCFVSVGPLVCWSHFGRQKDFNSTLFLYTLFFYWWGCGGICLNVYHSGFGWSVCLSSNNTFSSFRMILRDPIRKFDRTTNRPALSGLDEDGPVRLLQRLVITYAGSINLIESFTSMILSGGFGLSSGNCVSPLSQEARNRAKAKRNNSLFIFVRI